MSLKYGNVVTGIVDVLEVIEYSDKGGTFIEIIELT